MATKDFPMLWKVYDHIAAHPEEWEQTFWMSRKLDNSCGTAFCFAGHAVDISLQGYEAQWGDDAPVDFARYIKRDGRSSAEPVDMVAREILGLDRREADLLFAGGNELEDIRNIIAGWESDENGKV